MAGFRRVTILKLPEGCECLGLDQQGRSVADVERGGGIVLREEEQIARKAGVFERCCWSFVLGQT